MSVKPMRALAAAAVFVAAVSLAGCSSDKAAPASSPSDSASAQAAMESTEADKMTQATLIDVRTPEEFAAGHLEGAINIDFNAEDFATRIGELDPAGTYVVYCRSGNRSGQALEQMKAMGFADVTNAGGYEQASADLGLPIVTN